MLRSILITTAFLTAAGSAWGQDDVLQLKNGTIVRGRVVDVNEKGIEFELSPNNVMFYKYELLKPHSAYSIRRRRMDKESARDQVEIGRFCARVGLNTQAVSHLREAIALEPRRKRELEKEIDDLRTAAASQLYQKAKGIIDSEDEENFTEAARALHKILDDYYDTPYGEQARDLDDRLAKKVRELREKRAKEAAKEKESRAAKAKQKRLKEPLDKVAAGFAAVAKDWANGLDQESAGSALRAIQAWQAAEQKLLAGKLSLGHIVKKSKEAWVQVRVADLLKQTDRWLIRIYLALSRIYAADNLDYLGGLRWCNKVLKIDPDNDKAFRLKLVITEAAMKARMEGREGR
jgi:hypothetical protein